MFPQQGRRFLGGVSQPGVTSCLGFGIAATPSASRSASAFWLVRATVLAGAPGRIRTRDPLLRRSFRAGGQPVRAQAGSRPCCP